MDYPEKITICEVGPRDGFQSEKPIATEEKLKVIKLLSSTGLKKIEVTSFVNPKAVPQMADAEQVVNACKQNNIDIILRGLALNVKGVERALECGIDEVKLTVSATESHSQKNANRSVKDAINSISKMVDLCLKAGKPVIGSIAVAFWCPYEGKVSLSKIIDICTDFKKIGISEINLADTAGMANPRLIKETLNELRYRMPELNIVLHLHDSYGMGLANALAAMQIGVEGFETSIGGLGGCPFIPNASGNIATEDLVNMSEMMGINTGLDINKLVSAAEFVENLVSHKLESHTYRARKQCV